MDGEVNGAQETGEEQQGLQGDQALGDEQSGQEAQQVGGEGAADGGDEAAEVAGVVAKADAEYRAALAERDRKIAELEAQVAEAFKSTEAAEGLAKQIEEMKAAADAERVGYELKLAGVSLRACRSRASCRVRRGALGRVGATRDRRGVR